MTEHPPANPGNIAAADLDDHDSSLGEDDLASSTASITSSILKYREENGRRYHAYKDGQYLAPNDEPEQNRMDLQHHLFKLTFGGKLYCCPAGKDNKKLQRVLDAGTGTGIWAVDMADSRPEAHVIGIDLSPIQPYWTAPNCVFQVDDLEEPWTYHEKFDFIFARTMSGSLASYPKFYEQSLENLSPGGWIEVQDVLWPPQSDDGTLGPETATIKWAKLCIDGMKGLGKSVDVAKDHKEMLEKAGFVNVKQEIFKWPQNTWPKDKHYQELGMWHYENIATSLEGLSLALFTRVLGWEKDELLVFLAQVRDEMKDRNIHSYWPLYVVYGQKPLVAAAA